MKIKCLSNTGKVLPIKVYNKNGYNADTVFQVTVNKEYIVYAIITIKKYNWFLICDDTYDGEYIYYPLYLPHHLFTIVDEKISNYWIVGEMADEYDDNKRTIIFGFRELIKERYFNGNLVEGFKREVEIFQEYKKKMDAEYLRV